MKGCHYADLYTPDAGRGVLAPLLVQAALTLAAAELLESGLSFLCLGAHGSYSNADSDPAMAFPALVFRPEGNASRFRSDEYSQLVSTARLEPELNKRLTLYRQIAQIVQDEAFVLPVGNTVVPYAMRSNVQGFGVLPGAAAYSPVYENIWLAS